jgi:hypothetical protein
LIQELERTDKTICMHKKVTMWSTRNDVVHWSHEKLATNGDGILQNVQTSTSRWLDSVDSIPYIAAE